MKNTQVEKIEGKDGTLVKASPLQVGYIAYTGLLALLCGDSLYRFGIVMKEKGLILMFAGAMIFTVVIFIYNSKYKKARVTKQLCYVFGLWSVFKFLVRFIS